MVMLLIAIMNYYYFFFAQEFQGYPVWMLATQSYLVAPEEGKTTDCLTGDNGCIIYCENFPYFGDPIDPRFSGYRRVGCL